MRLTFKLKLILLGVVFFAVYRMVYSVGNSIDVPGNSNDNYANNDKNIPCVESKVTPHVVGGWYPVFFESYSENKINQIITTIKEGRAAKIVISFDQNKSLAIKIKTAIESKTNFMAELSHVAHKDDTAQYNHMLVVVTVWNNYN